MSKETFSKVKTSTLISIIVHGAHTMGLELAKKLINQGSKVIVIDNFNKDTKPFITELKKLGNADFIAFEGLTELFKTLNRFDYLFYLQSSYLEGKEEFKSKDFLEESNHLDQCLKASLKYSAKVAVITSLQLNKLLTEQQATSASSKPSPYSPLEIQKYAETLTAEYHDKSKLNVRILRLASILGGNFLPDDDHDLMDVLTESVAREQITIKGEGLDVHYLVHIEDAIYGILKLTFAENTIGEVITLANNKAYTTLSVAYKVLELNTNATTIKFEPTNERRYLMHGVYSPAPNAEQYGWAQKVTLEESLVQTLEKLYKEKNKTWENKPDTEQKVTSQSAVVSPLPGSSSKVETTALSPKSKKPIAATVKTPLGLLLDRLSAPFNRVGKSMGEAATRSSEAINYRSVFFFFGLTLIFSFISYFLLTPIVTIGVSSYLIYKDAKAAYTEVIELDFNNSRLELMKVQDRMKKVEDNVTRLEWAFKLTQQEELYENISQITFAAKYAIEGANDMAIALDPLAQYVKEFEPAISFGEDGVKTTREYRDYLVALRENRGSLEKASYNISLATSIMEGTDASDFPKPLQKYIVELKTKSRKVSEILEPFEQTVIFLPELLGVDERQRYLVLLQNPSELRSTGGWLSSYALIGIENGQIRQLDVDDIYNVDGILKVQGKQYTPPASMVSALGVNEWALSLSNWNPNFPDAANDAQFFIKESGKAYELDGVLTFDVTLIQQLLDHWDGLNVPGEDEKVTSDNLYNKIFEIHTDFIPGSRRKSTFIANLANETLKRLLNSDAEGYQAVSSILMDAVEQKHILISLSNEEANRYVDEQGWNGRIRSSNLATPVPVEWNWGANKANLFLERTTSVSMDIRSEDEIRYTYSVSLRNNSDTRSYPEGDYKNWMRILLPVGAEIVSTSGFESNVHKTYIENGYLYLAGWFNTDINDTNTLEISYTLKRSQIDAKFYPIKVDGDTISLDLDIYKQPGTDEDPYKLTVIYPDDWAVTDADDMSRDVGQLSTQFDQASEQEFSLIWNYK